MRNSPNRIVATVFGAVYLLVGLLGFAVTGGVSFVATEGGLLLDGRLEVSLRPSSIVLHPLTFLPQHSNGMTFIAQDAGGAELVRRPMFSVGGGFVVDEADMDRSIAEVAAEVYRRWAG